MPIMLVFGSSIVPPALSPPTLPFISMLPIAPQAQLDDDDDFNNSSSFTFAPDNIDDNTTIGRMPQLGNTLLDPQVIRTRIFSADTNSCYRFVDANSNDDFDLLIQPTITLPFVGALSLLLSLPPPSPPTIPTVTRLDIIITGPNEQTTTAPVTSSLAPLLVLILACLYLYSLYLRRCLLRRVVLLRSLVQQFRVPTNRASLRYRSLARVLAETYRIRQQYQENSSRRKIYIVGLRISITECKTNISLENVKKRAGGRLYLHTCRIIETELGEQLFGDARYTLYIENGYKCQRYSKNSSKQLLQPSNIYTRCRANLGPKCTLSARLQNSTLRKPKKPASPKDAGSPACGPSNDPFGSGPFGRGSSRGGLGSGPSFRPGGSASSASFIT